jgi:hypothetical protein
MTTSAPGSWSHVPAIHLAVASGHVVVAVAGLVAATAMVVAGTSPGAGLGGIFATLGLVLGAVVLAFGAAAVACFHLWRRDPRRAVRLALVLGVVELTAGIACGWGAAVSVASYGELDLWGSPLVAPAVLLLALGLTAVVHSSRVLRTPGDSTRTP